MPTVYVLSGEEIHCNVFVNYNTIRLKSRAWFRPQMVKIAVELRWKFSLQSATLLETLTPGRQPYTLTHG